MMRLSLLLLLMLQATPKPKPTPTPEWMSPPITAGTSNVMFNTGGTWASALSTPTMVIHFSGDVILEVKSPDGKKLIVAADGKVTGDLPHDQAADVFWKAIAQAYPPICKKERGL